MEVSRWPSKSHVSTPWVSVGVQGPVVATWAAVREAPSLAAPSRPQDGQGDSVAPGKKEQLGREHNGCSRQIQTAKFSYFWRVSNERIKEVSKTALGFSSFCVFSSIPSLPGPQANPSPGDARANPIPRREAVSKLLSH